MKKAPNQTNASGKASYSSRKAKPAMTELFDTAVTSLLRPPKVLDRLAAGHGAHSHAHGGGGGAPMDIVETLVEYN